MARPKREQPAAASGEAAAESQESKVAGTVPMVRDEPQHPGGPVTADVHPDEVDSFASAGWYVKKSQ